jgi:D-alanyl-D-alanine carboxypeptidase
MDASGRARADSGEAGRGRAGRGEAGSRRGAGDADPPAHERARIVERLDALLDGLVAKRHVRHALLAVETADRSFGWSGARGIADPDGRPLEVDDLVPIASVTKLFTSTLVHRLIEDGLIDLDASITTYLGDIQGIHSLDDIDRTDQITVRHLLSHTSGLPDYYLDAPKEGLSLHEQILRDGDRAFDLDEVVEVIRGLRPHFPPQELAAGGRCKVRYADTNFQLLGGIVAAVTATSFDDALREQLLGPARLVRTFARRDVPTDDDVAAVWAGADHLDIPEVLASLGPDGGLISTAGDALAFGRALYAGELFDREETLAVMQRPWRTFGFPRDRAAVMAPNWPVQSGVGMLRFQTPRLLARGRRIPAVVGQTGATGSWLWYCPELEVLTFGTVGQVTAAGAPYRLLPRLLRILAER